MQTTSEQISAQDLNIVFGQLLGLVLTRGKPYTSSNHTQRTYTIQSDLFTHPITASVQHKQVDLELKDKHLLIHFYKHGQSTGHVKAMIEIPHEGKVVVTNKEGPWQDHLTEIYAKIQSLLAGLPSYILTIDNVDDAKLARARELYE